MKIRIIGTAEECIAAKEVKRMPKNKRTDLTEEESEKERRPQQKVTYIELKDPYETYRRPYGLLAKAGISTAGMRPRDAWNAVNELAEGKGAAKGFARACATARAAAAEE